jgi:hypothetical protein
VEVFPSPKIHSHAFGLLVELSVNDIGAFVQTVAGVAVKLTIGLMVPTLTVSVVETVQPPLVVMVSFTT